MIKNLLLVIAIVITIAIAYSIGKKQDNAQVNDLKKQMDNLKSQMNLQGQNLRSSYKKLHRSLDLHMAETSIESAIHDTLDQNFGQAKIAVDSAKNYLKGTTGRHISQGDIEALTEKLNEAQDKLSRLDRKALQVLNSADQKTRELILKNSQ